MPTSWQFPHCLKQMILCRHHAMMHSANDDNATSGPYRPVSCYRCSFPSCRSPLGCLRLLFVPCLPSSSSSLAGGTERQTSQLWSPGQFLPHMIIFAIIWSWDPFPVTHPRKHCHCCVYQFTNKNPEPKVSFKVKVFRN